MSRRRKPGTAEGPNGGEFACNMARHLQNPAAHSLFETVARLTRLGAIDKENREAYAQDPSASMERGILTAPQTTLADAAGVSRDFVRRQMRKLRALGILIPRQRGRNNLGWLEEASYEVVTHFEFSLRHPCPAAHYTKAQRVAEGQH
jgi:hypothetical protein